METIQPTKAVLAPGYSISIRQTSAGDYITIRIERPTGLTGLPLYETILLSTREARELRWLLMNAALQ